MTERTTVPLQELFDDALSKSKYHVHKHKKRTKWNNKSGFFRVQRIKCRGCKDGYTWLYRVTTSNGEHRITRTNLLRLKNDIKAMGFRWFVTNEENAKKTAKEAHFTLDTLR